MTQGKHTAFRLAATAALLSAGLLPAAAEPGSATLTNAAGIPAAGPVQPGPAPVAVASPPAPAPDLVRVTLPPDVVNVAALGQPFLPGLTPRPDGALAAAPGVDPGLLRQAIEAYRRGEVASGDEARAKIEDPAARALLEWLAIRSGAALGFDRIAAFARDNADWPVAASLRRRAEEALLFNRKPAAAVRAFFATQRPVSPAGKLALAKALRADGLARDAAEVIRESWRADTFSREFEERILEDFDDVITRSDHRDRMERFLLKQNWSAASRSAARAGKDYLTLVKARIAVEDRSKKAEALLDAVPAHLRSDTSYLFARAQWLRRKERAAEAAQVIAGVTRDPRVLADGDEWWTERRMIARQLLDRGDAKAAYAVVRHHGAASAAKRIEAEFHSGWIALRFLDDPDTAAWHFSQAASIAETPISVARAAYWQGRAEEARGEAGLAREHFERAAAHPIAYYGQLARAKLGYTNLPLRMAQEAADEERAAFLASTPARALRLLHEIGAGDLALPLYAELGQNVANPSKLDALGDLAVEKKDARGLLAIGKAAVQRGLPLDLHAYPTIGIPSFEPVGERVEKAMVYAIARQESAFDPKAQSGAGARGLMQLMPATAKRTATRFGLGFDVNRLVQDPVYNARVGAAHLGELMDDWKGSYILTFAAYNAGGGNVKKWIEAYGDPRQPGVDPIDWVERIPFSETRNYVQRVMENLQVYRHRLESRSAYLFENDLRHSRLVR